MWSSLSEWIGQNACDPLDVCGMMGMWHHPGALGVLLQSIIVPSIHFKHSSHFLWLLHRDHCQLPGQLQGYIHPYNMWNFEKHI
jgi:hypothetical protein